jgi:hypothetical protein
MGPRRINGIFHHPSFVFGNSVCSVRDCRGFCIVHNGAGSRTSAEQKLNQVTEASSMTVTARDVQDWSPSSDTNKDIPYELQSSKRKGGDLDEAIFIPESTMNIMRTKRICQHKINC